MERPSHPSPPFFTLVCLLYPSLPRRMEKGKAGGRDKPSHLPFALYPSISIYLLQRHSNGGPHLLHPLLPALPPLTRKHFHINNRAISLHANPSKRGARANPAAAAAAIGVCVCVRLVRASVCVYVCVCVCVFVMHNGTRK